MSSEQDGVVVESVDEIPLCLGCGLMSHHIHEETPLCGDCWQRRNWWQHQGMHKHVTKHGDCRHTTPLCPAVQSHEYKMVKDEIVYLDTRDCKRCDGYILFGEFDWRATA